MYKYQGTYYFPTASPLMQDTLDKMSSACLMIHLAIEGVGNKALQTMKNVDHCLLTSLIISYVV